MKYVIFISFLLLIGCSGVENCPVKDLQMVVEAPEGPYKRRSEPMSVPEPLSVSLFAVGVLSAFYVRRKKGGGE